MKVTEILNEGAFIVKSKDGVEKRFKDADSVEAKAWQSSIQLKTKFPKYGKVYWERQADNSNYTGVLPWDKIQVQEVEDQLEKIIKEGSFGSVEGYHLVKHGTMDVEGLNLATVTVHITQSFDKEDDAGERVLDTVNIKLRRDSKRPGKLIFAAFES